MPNKFSTTPLPETALLYETSRRLQWPLLHQILNPSRY